MVKGLMRKRIVIGSSRNTEEISMLIKKQGGDPIVRSLQGTVFLEEKEVGPGLKELLLKGTDWAIFTTGIGTQTLLVIAEKQGMKEPFTNMVQQSQIASRGYKTLSTLKKLGFS